MSVLIRGMRIPLIVCTLFSLSISLNAMEKKPYHHVYKDGKLYAFRNLEGCLLYTSPSPRDEALSRLPSSA